MSANRQDAADLRHAPKARVVLIDPQPANTFDKLILLAVSNFFCSILEIRDAWETRKVDLSQRTGGDRSNQDGLGHELKVVWFKFLR